MSIRLLVEILGIFLVFFWVLGCVSFYLFFCIIMCDYECVNFFVKYILDFIVYWYFNYDEFNLYQFFILFMVKVGYKIVFDLELLNVVMFEIFCYVYDINWNRCNYLFFICEVYVFC